MGVGLTITVVGMLVVFSFLALLVVFSRLMSVIIVKFFPEAEEPEKPVRRTVGSADTDVAVAIAAVKAFTKS
ncbi:MAG: OadG family protein [Spirochaetales bacterium]|nr:OadG family protein [Spirochaetales bacterium]